MSSVKEQFHRPKQHFHISLPFIHQEELAPRYYLQLFLVVGNFWFSEHKCRPQFRRDHEILPQHFIKLPELAPVSDPDEVATGYISHYLLLL